MAAHGRTGRPGADVTQRGRAGSAVSGEAANSTLLLLRRRQALCERRRGKLGVGQITLTAVTTATASQRRESRVRASAARGAAPAGLQRALAGLSCTRARIRAAATSAVILQRPRRRRRAGRTAARGRERRCRTGRGAARGRQVAPETGAARANGHRRRGRLAPRVPRSSAREAAPAVAGRSDAASRLRLFQMSVDRIRTTTSF